MSCYALMNILAVRDLTEGQKSVWQYLLFRANGAKVCWPKVEDIADYLNMSRRNVMAATKKLADTGRIRISRRYKDTNNYHMLDVPGLHDVPDFGSHAAAVTTPESDVQKTAPKADVQKTAPQSEVQKTSPMEPLTCKKAHSEVQKTSPESVQQESNKEGTLLRNADAAAPLPALASQTDIRKVVWDDGKAIVRQLTGKLDTPARKQIGAFLREAKDDCSVVMEALRAAAREGPVEPIPWIMASIQARLRTQPVYKLPANQIADAMGLLTKENREAFAAGLIVDHSAFLNGGG